MQFCDVALQKRLFRIQVWKDSVAENVLYSWIKSTNTRARLFKTNDVVS